MRVEQPAGAKGSLKWIQRAVNERWPSLDDPILAATRENSLRWLSPVREDAYAEYRDGAFLDLIGHGRLRAQLQSFWPRRGPQWDALGHVGERGVLLVEAKAHIREMCSPGSSAGPASRAIIAQRLREVAAALGAGGDADWTGAFYQMANRLAHLWFLREHGVEAWLVFVGFLGDRAMNGPASAEAWGAAQTVAEYALGLPVRHTLSSFVIHVHPQVPHD